MNQMQRETPYVLGHSEAELARLERQGEIFGSETRSVLLRAGLVPGMRVLDVGCGVGDVSLIAADIVGRSGSVVGIDRAETALSLARARAARAGYDKLTFHEADLYSFEPDGRFDAVVGRFILMHIADPVGAIRRLTGFLDPGGTVAFIELDIDQAGAVPELPLLRRCIGWITATYRLVGAEPNMGSQLYATFRAAKLSPALAGMTRIESAAGMVAFSFAAQTLAILLPKAEAAGIVSASEADISTLAERMHREGAGGEHCIFMPRLVGAWARSGSA
jgi:ubiquinone/menaquinone biosynthesis C-methylase UbiE